MVGTKTWGRWHISAFWLVLGLCEAEQVTLPLWAGTCRAGKPPRVRVPWDWRWWGHGLRLESGPASQLLSLPRPTRHSPHPLLAPFPSAEV